MAETPDELYFISLSLESKPYSIPSEGRNERQLRVLNKFRSPHLQKREAHRTGALFFRLDQGRPGKTWPDPRSGLDTGHYLSGEEPHGVLGIRQGYGVEIDLQRSYLESTHPGGVIVNLRDELIRGPHPSGALGHHGMKVFP